MPSPKKFYTDMAGVLIPFATFAGGLTLATQFIITCPCSRLQGILAMASYLLLAAPLYLLSIYLLLYRAEGPPGGGDGGDGDGGLIDNMNFADYWQHAIVVCQFIVAGALICGGFAFIGAALLVAQTDAKGVAPAGVALLSVAIFVCMLAGIFIPCRGPFTELHVQYQWLPGTRQKVIFTCFVIVLLELAPAGAAIIVSGIKLSKMPVHWGCNFYSGNDPMTNSALSSCQSLHGILSTTPPIPDVTIGTVTIGSVLASVPTPVVALSISSLSIPTPLVNINSLIIPTPSLDVTLAISGNIPTPIITVASVIVSFPSTVEILDPPSVIEVQVDAIGSFNCTGQNVECSNNLTANVGVLSRT